MMMHSKSKTMNELIIYHPSTDIIAEVPILSTAKVVRQIMGEHYCEIPFSLHKYVDFPRGSYIEYKGAQYHLMRDAVPEPIADIDGYKYVLKFYAREHLMSACRLKWLASSAKEITFSLTTTIKEYAQLIVDNMNLYDVEGYEWKIEVIGIGDDITKNINFNGNSCWDAATEISKVFKCEWWAEERIGLNGNIYIYLCFGRLYYGEYIDIREGEIITRFPANKRGEDADYGTRFYVYGGTKNIPANYYTADSGTTNHISEKRLHLPNGHGYIDVVEGLSPSQIVEQVIILDNIFPRSEELITGISYRTAVVEGKSTTHYTMECANTNFHPSMIQGTLGCVFTSGALNGREFGLKVADAREGETFDKKFEIIPITEGESEPITIPNEYLKPKTNDTFILTGIELPEENVTAAENELLKEGESQAEMRYRDTNVYDCKTDPIYCYNNNIDLEIGQRVICRGVQFGANGRKTRIQGYEKRFINSFEATYNIGDNDTYSRSKALHAELVGVTNRLEDNINGNRNRLEGSISKVDDTANEAQSWIDNFHDLPVSQFPAQVHLTSQLRNESYAIELSNIRRIRSAVRLETNGYSDKVQLRDSNGILLYDKNGVALYAASLTPQAYKDFTSAADRYEELLIQRMSATTPLTNEELAEFNQAQSKVYEQMAKIEAENIEANNLSFLRNIFGAGSILNSYAAILSSIIAVQNTEGNIRAGMYGGGVTSLDEAGYKHDAYGTLMMFAGSENANSASDAKFRVYENGGVFTGLHRKSITRIDASNLKHYVDDDNTLNIDKAGGYIVIDGSSNTTENQIKIELPCIYRDDQGLMAYYPNKRPSFEDVFYNGTGFYNQISIVGEVFTIVFVNEIDSGKWCLNVPLYVEEEVYNEDGNINTYARVSHACMIAQLGIPQSYTCVSGIGNDGNIVVGWKPISKAL